MLTYKKHPDGLRNEAHHFFIKRFSRFITANQVEVNILYLVLSVFAVWRLTHLFNKEDGPFDIIYLIRKKAGNSFFGKLMDCFYCLSIWMALPFGLWLGTTWIERILVWLALSGAAALLEQATSNNDNNNNNETPTYQED